MEFSQRKPTRLPDFDYGAPGYYFITVCTQGHRCLFSRIVGAGLPDGPESRLTSCGVVVREQLEQMRDFYDNICIDQYVIMPNHIHMILQIKENGPPRMSAPTVSEFVGTFKRFCNRQFGRNVWQRSFHDHVIRGEADYLGIWEYIRYNPAKWREDQFYRAEEKD